MEEHEELFQQFRMALRRFEEIMEEDKSDIIRDSALQRFEFTIELAWKTMKTCLRWGENVICRSPNACFKEAYKVGWIDYEQRWIDAMSLRNRIAHVYNEDMAEEIYRQLPEMVELFQKFEKQLQKRLEE